MSKFKVRDKVRVVQAEYGAWGANGKVGIITNKLAFNGLNNKKGIHVELENDNYIWNIGENPKLELIESAIPNKSIHIYANGTTTTAVLKECNNVIKTTMAKCHPDDTYDFESGARIAFDRLCNNLAESSKFTKVKEVSRSAKVGEYVKIIDKSGNKDSKIGQICRCIGIDDGLYKLKVINRNIEFEVWSEKYVVLENYVPEEKPKFKPYLVNHHNQKVGYIGEETIQEDLLGNKLKVGDTVILYYKNRKHGERTICKINNIDFVVGVQNCSFKQGRCDEWSIIKNRSYNKIDNLGKVCTTTYILSE